jgi:hypothetical protein
LACECQDPSHGALPDLLPYLFIPALTLHSLVVSSLALLSGLS